MTFAFKTAEGEWLEVTGALLPGFGEPDPDGVRHGVTVSEAFVASLPPEIRAARGLAEIVEAEPPAGVVITDKRLVDVAGVPHREFDSEALPADDLAALLQRRKSEIDAAATARIAGLGPSWKQLDLMCQAIALLDAGQSRELTQDEVVARAGLRQVLSWTLSVRAHAETLKGQLPADGPGLVAFDITAGWPAPLA
jgi:hypothetical protein